MKKVDLNKLFDANEVKDICVGYVKDKKSARQLAEEHKTYHRVICCLLRKHNITIRPKAIVLDEAIEARVCTEYLLDKKSVRELAKKHKVNRSIISRALKKHGIDIRPKAGNGITLDGYRKIWDSNEQRQRYEQNIVWELHHGPIPEGYVVHHKDFNKLNNAEWNLQLMTIEDHSRVHNPAYRRQDGDWNKPWEKWCKGGCGRWLHLDEFYGPEDEEKINIRSRCRECFREHRRKYANKNRERINKQRRERWAKQKTAAS